MNTDEPVAETKRDAMLAEVRGRIDSIDREIVNLIAQRQRWVVRAGQMKRDETGVRAPRRVEQVVARVRRMAPKAGASPDVVEVTYRAMIDGFIALEMSVLEAGVRERDAPSQPAQVSKT